MGAKLLCAPVLLCVSMHAQKPTQTPAPLPPVQTNPSSIPTVSSGAKSAATVTTVTPAPKRDAPEGPQPGQAIDRLIATVNGELVLESDVAEEQRMAVLQPVGNPTGEMARSQAIERLIDRTLILQQAKLQAEPDVSDAEVQTQLLTLRKQLPACKVANCETDAGWAAYLKQNRLSQAELTRFWRQRMEVLHYIEVRFRSGVQITPEQVREYFEKSMLPEYQKRGVTPPPLDSISDRIEEVLLQQQVTALLQDWLKSLRSQGSVVMMKPGEMAP